MSSHYPSFVANTGIAKVPMVGRICQSMGSMFIRRDANDSVHGDASVTGNAARMMARLTDPEAPRMLIFPEGTTTNGQSLLPFKKGPFLAKMPVQPVLLKYEYDTFSPAWETISPVRRHPDSCPLEPSEPRNPHQNKRYSGLLCAPLPLLAQEDPQKQME